MGSCHIGDMGNSLQLQRNRAALHRAQRQAVRASTAVVEKAGPAAQLAVKRPPKLLAAKETPVKPEQ